MSGRQAFRDAMRKQPQLATSDAPWDSQARLLAWLATCVSVIAFLFYYKAGAILLYGDAVAHINIARRVFDSRTPGLLQLGTVWLPLPHLLMVPFLVSKGMWQSGLGGSIPSMGAYVFGAIGVFRLTRGTLAVDQESEAPARVAAWTAAVIYAANPNLIYMQATGMGETLYLAFFIWAVVYCSEALRGDGAALIKCGYCLAAACLTRYDGWFLAAATAGVVIVICLADRAGRFSESERPAQARGSEAFPSRVVARFVLIAAAAPALWLAYNSIIYRNPLEFENGPYSAKAIERKTQSSGNPGHPGSGNLVLAARYYLKSAEANVAANEWMQRMWLLLGAGGIACALYFHIRLRDLKKSRRWLATALLLTPLPFYALSVAYGGVPIFVPQFWPFTHYNVRYGLQLLPAFALALAWLIFAALRSKSWKPAARLAPVLGVLALVFASYASAWRATPVCLEEAQSNMRTRNQLEGDLAQWLRRLPDHATLLMYLGDHVGALERAGIPLKNTINEGNHRVWKQPSDADGLWERALRNPTGYADYILAFEGDPVWQAVHDLHLRALVEIHVSGQARAVLYRVR